MDVLSFGRFSQFPAERLLNADAAGTFGLPLISVPKVSQVSINA
jgi:hypothetical protein